jgi:hypothetical protein
VKAAIRIASRSVALLEQHIEIAIFDVAQDDVRRRLPHER